jgi:hypothetical protein
MDAKGLIIGVGMIAAGAAMAIAVPIVDSRSLEERSAREGQFSHRCT